jgi:ABC-type Fe3+ transport system permease subunit
MQGIGKNIFTSLFIGMLFAIGGALIGLVVGGLLARTTWLADPGGGMVILLLLFAGGLISGSYGFVSTLNKLQKRQTNPN